MKNKHCTWWLVTALVLVLLAVPGRPVPVTVIVTVIGVALDALDIIDIATDGDNDTLRNTNATLTQNQITEVGDDTKYTVVTDAIVTSGDEARQVRVTVYLDDDTSMSQETTDFFETTHATFTFDLEGLYTGEDSVSADIELLKYHIIQMKMLVVDSKTRGPQNFQINEAYQLQVDVSPGTHEVRHNETFTSRLERNVRTRKTGSASGHNVQDAFNGLFLNSAGYDESGFLVLHTYSSTHSDMPMPIETSGDFSWLDTLMGRAPGTANLALISFEKTPPHVVPQTFTLSPLKATFRIPAENFTVARGGDYTHTVSLNAVEMTCNGGKIWKGDSDTTINPFTPDIAGTWAGLFGATTIVFEFTPPTPGTYLVRDMSIGGTIVETGAYTMGSPLLTLIPDPPADPTPRPHAVLSSSPSNLIILDENRMMMNFTAGSNVSSGSIEGSILDLPVGFSDHALVAAFDASGGFSNRPVAASTVSLSGHYELPGLVDGPYLVAAYVVEPVPPVPLPADFSGTYNMRTSTIGGTNTPTVVPVVGGAPTFFDFSMMPDEVLPPEVFVVSTHTGGGEISSVDLDLQDHATLQCTGQYGRVEISTPTSNWTTVLGSVTGVPPAWAWTSWQTMAEDSALFRLAYP